MANSEQLDILRRGAPRWNEWVHSNGRSTPDLSGANLNGTVLAEADLRGVDLSGARLIKANLGRADLRGANLAKANLIEANLAGADFRGADLSGADFKNANLTGAIFHDADLSHARLITATVGEANLSGANLTSADLTGADLIGRDLSGANFEHADLSAANLAQAVLRKASFAGTKLARKSFLEADLREANLGAADLSSAEFTGANLGKANLEGALLKGASFLGANLRGANLRGAHVDNADFTGAELADAGLQETNLTGAVGLFAKQLVSADLSGAELPEELAAFPALAAARKAARVASKLFLALLVFAAYMILLVAATSDATLLADRPPAPLAIFGGGIPILGFYLIAPVLLVGLFAITHLYAQRLWSQVAILPAVFPDGKRLDVAVNAMILKWIFVWRRPRLRDPEPPLLLPLYCAAALGYWGIVPLALLLVWLRCLVCQELVWSLWHLMLFMASLAISYISYGATADALSSRRVRLTVDGLRIRPLRLAAAGALMLLLVFLSVPAVSESVPGQSWRNAFVRADFTGRDVSVKPGGWDGSNLEAVQGAQMSRRNLTGVSAPEAFLVNADLSFAMMIRAQLPQADLRGATLGSADLREAGLPGANLQGANLNSADLSGGNMEAVNFHKADLRGSRLFSANLRDADLTEADLRGVKLNAADLTGAKLSGANLTGANFYEAVLFRADLRGADLSGAEQLSQEQLEKANGDTSTRLPAGLRRPESWSSGGSSKS